MTLLWSARMRLGCLAALLLLINCAWAEVTEGAAGEISRGTAKRVGFVRPVPPRRANVLVVAGASIGQFLIEVAPGTDVRRLAASIDQALNAGSAAVRVVVSRDGRIGAGWSHARLGQRQDANQIPLDDLRRAIESEGIRPSFGVKLLRSLTTEPPLRGGVTTVESRNVPLGERPVDLTVRGELTPFTLGQLALAAFLPLAVMLGGASLAGKRAKDGTASPTERDKGTARRVRRSVSAGLVCTVLLAVVFLTGGSLPLISDLWFGSTANWWLGPILVVHAVAGLVLLKRVESVPIEDPNPALAALASPPDPWREGWIARRLRAERWLSLSLLLLPATLISLAWLLRSQALVFLGVAVAGSAVFLGLCLAPFLLSRFRPELVDPPEFEPGLRDELRSLANRLGQDAPRLEPATRSSRRDDLMPLSDRGAITLPDHFVRAFDPEEQRFWLGYALARRPSLRAQERWAVGMVLSGNAALAWITVFGPTAPALAVAAVLAVAMVSVASSSIRRTKGVPENLNELGFSPEVTHRAVRRMLELSPRLRLPEDLLRTAGVDRRL